MRLINFLLVIFLATNNALSTSVDAGTRLLRKVDAEDEERIQFNFGLWIDWFRPLPHQFKRMKTQPAYRNYIFENWRQGWKNLDEVTTYMKDQGLTDTAINQFKAAYSAYLTKHPYNKSNYEVTGLVR
ncbi:RxLR effector protein [Phytophthora megakarya]|uniref:RxLR effector protein n=1 Tax=Phytophthora megakarya TaxID=4795 RepID=A0A225VB36_9STRA|nr:RxLR effector protein [Phytophthora megakarya]